MNKKNNLGVLVVGALLGGTIGLLFAPRKGKETREDIKNKIKNLKNNIKEIDYNETQDELQMKIKEIENDIKDLDKEKVLEQAKEKSEDISNKIDSLIDMAIDKGNDTIEKAVEILRKKAIKVTKNVINKLEKKEK